MYTSFFYIGGDTSPGHDLLISAHTVDAFTFSILGTVSMFAVNRGCEQVFEEVKV